MHIQSEGDLSVMLNKFIYRYCVINDFIFVRTIWSKID